MHVAEVSTQADVGLTQVIRHGAPKRVADIERLRRCAYDANAEELSAHAASDKSRVLIYDAISRHVI